MNKLNIKEIYLNEIINIFKNYCPNAEIWVYGSRLNGESHEGSDLDLIVKNFNDDTLNLAELKRRLNNSNVPFLIDINEFDRLPQSFQEEILKNYKPVIF